MTITGQIGLLRNGTDLVARALQWGTRSDTYHVVVAISDTHCVSAEPGGSRYRPITDYPRIYWSSFDLTPAQRQIIADAAHTYVPRPYNYAIYPALFWQRITGHRVAAWVANWLAHRPNENCSQLSDDVYNRAGLHLFEDVAEIVTPGDFERLFYTYGFLRQDTTKLRTP